MSSYARVATLAGSSAHRHLRLRGDDQAEGPVAADLHDGHDDVRRRRPVARPRPPHLSGRRAVSRRRGSDQPRARPGHRPHHEADGRPPGGLGPGVGARGDRLRRRCSAAPRSRCCRSRSTRLPRCWRCRGFLGYVLVYTMWLKRTTPQNIVIGGAAGAVPPLVAWAAVTGGLRRHAAVPVRDRLLLDAAALLVAVAADEGRVRARGRADAAGGARRGGDPPPDPALRRPAVRGVAAAVLRGGVRSDLPGLLGAARRGLHLRSVRPACADRPAATHSGSTCSRSPTWRCCSAAMVADARL